MTEKDYKDYIMRGDVVEALLLPNRFAQTGFYSDEIISDTIVAAVKAVEILPAADVAPVIHAHWIFGEFNGIGTPVWCSNCGERTSNIADMNLWLTHPSHKYCGRCGAKMDLKEAE